MVRLGGHSMTRLLARVVLGALVVGSMVAWPSLPAEIPLHFGVDGEPDRWGQKSLMGWFALPCIAVLVSLLFGWVRARAGDRPEMLNIPGKERLLNLPPRQRREAVLRILGALGAVEVGTLLILALIQTGIWFSAADGAGQGWILAAVALSLLGSPVLLVVLLLRAQAAVRDGEAAAEESA